MLDLLDMRRRVGLTQKEVATKLDVDQSSLSHWERGENKILRKYHKKLADIYGVTVEDIVKACKR